MIHEGFPKWSPVSSDDFGHYETVYPFANHDERLHPQSEHIPHICTDRTIHIGRQKDLERMVVHYTLPHMNHIAGALDWTAGEMSTGELMTGELPVTRDLKPEEKSFEPVRRGDVSSETVRQNYIDNIRLGLEYVSVLLHNINAKKTIISADHGEGLGENGIWSHPFGCPVSTVKNVPWMTTIASDEQTYQSQFGSLDRAPTQRELVEHLKAMGYST